MSNTKERTIEEINLADSFDDDSVYNVVMHNDDFTPFEYVIVVLATVFGYDPEQGLNIAMHIDSNGSAIVATTSMEAAYAKVDSVNQLNEQYGFLLQTTVEEA
jgi:ATP-dependent Clp protease adaptor protein ClpS